MRARHLVPNAFTLANIAFGFASVVSSAEGELGRACLLIFFAALCDMSDGKLARLLGATSRFGTELDSLSDAMSFGLAPAFLVYSAALQRLGAPGEAVAIFYVLCGALRLARFNVDTREISKVTFLGCPIPVAAGYLVSLVLVHDRLPLWVIASATLAVGLAMITTVKIPKFTQGGTPGFMLYVGVALFIALLARPSAWTWHLWNGWNVVMLVVNYVLLSRRGHLRRTAGGTAGPTA